MRSFKSKGLALFLLVAMCGQVAAYPLLMCPDMEPSSGMIDTAQQSSSMEHHDTHADHANHGADHTSKSGEAENHTCELCVSCSSVSISEYGPVNNELASDLTILSYTNPLQNSSLDQPFRPPIAA